MDVLKCICHLSIILEVVLSLIGAEGTGYGGEDTRDAMEVVNAASIVQANLPLEDAA